MYSFNISCSVNSPLGPMLTAAVQTPVTMKDSDELSHAQRSAGDISSWADLDKRLLMFTYYLLFESKSSLIIVSNKYERWLLQMLPRVFWINTCQLINSLRSKFSAIHNKQQFLVFKEFTVLQNSNYLRKISLK